MAMIEIDTHEGFLVPAFPNPVCDCRPIVLSAAAHSRTHTYTWKHS